MVAAAASEPRSVDADRGPALVGPFVIGAKSGPQVGGLKAKKNQ